MANHCPDGFFSLLGIAQLPSGWSDSDVGSVGTSGTATYSNGIFTVSGSGQSGVDEYSADTFHFAYQPLDGDGTIIARLVNVQGGTSGLASAGVMIRETTDTGAVNADSEYLPAYYNAYFGYRASTGGSPSMSQSPTSPSLPYWIKISQWQRFQQLYFPRIGRSGRR